jgi:hypothetical protein
MLLPILSSQNYLEQFGDCDHYALNVIFIPYFRDYNWLLKNGHKKYVHFLKAKNTFEKNK